MNVLFVCSRNRLRSPTAEVVFSQHEGLEVLSAGTASDAETQVSADLIAWAEVIFAMENHHRDSLGKRFGKLLETKRLVVLGIRDDYAYLDPKLIEILRKKASPHLLGVVS